MDPLAGLLDDVRTKGALFGQSVMRPPWSLRFADGAPVTMLVPVRGQAWVHPGTAGDEPLVARVGDIAIVVGWAPFTVADAPELAERARSSATVARLDPTISLRTCDEPGPDDGSAVLLTGTYHVEGPMSHRLLGVLPRLVVVRDERWVDEGVRGEGELCPLMDVTFAEVARHKPGQQAVLDRLLDMLLLTTLREWFDRPEAEAPAWYRGYDDPVVGPALRLIHDEPARPWTVATLAREAGVSRATLARRFADVMGEPPMNHLRSWRLALAADLLHRTDASVDVIARRVGYVNGYSLSVAFKRTLGTRPTDHRPTRPHPHHPAA